MIERFEKFQQALIGHLNRALCLSTPLTVDDLPAELDRELADHEKDVMQAARGLENALDRLDSFIEENS